MCVCLGLWVRVCVWVNGCVGGHGYDLCDQCPQPILSSVKKVICKARIQMLSIRIPFAACPKTPNRHAHRMVRHPFPLAESTVISTPLLEFLREKKHAAKVTAAYVHAYCRVETFQDLIYFLL